jgi:hypothetical protein
MANQLNFDPGIIEKYADHLYRRAASLVMGTTVVGAIVGAIFGGVPLTHYADWPIPTAPATRRRCSAR